MKKNKLVLVSLLTIIFFVALGVYIYKLETGYVQNDRVYNNLSVTNNQPILDSVQVISKDDGIHFILNGKNLTGVKTVFVNVSSNAAGNFFTPVSVSNDGTRLDVKPSQIKDGNSYKVQAGGNEDDINFKGTRPNALVSNTLVVTVPINSSLNSSQTYPNSYTFNSKESGILPDIYFQYPSIFGSKPTLISSRSTNSPEKMSDDGAGFVEFNPTGAVGSNGLRMTFFIKSNTENSFESFISKTAIAGGWDSSKYFQVNSYNVARLRYASQSHYDADVGWYFIDLKQGNILAISTEGDKKYLYDDDQNGYSTRDRIISTLSIGQISSITDPSWITVEDKSGQFYFKVPSTFDPKVVSDFNLQQGQDIQIIVGNRYVQSLSVTGQVLTNWQISSGHTGVGCSIEGTSPKGGSVSTSIVKVNGLSFYEVGDYDHGAGSETDATRYVQLLPGKNQCRYIEFRRDSSAVGSITGIYPADQANLIMNNDARIDESVKALIPQILSTITVQ